MLRSSSLAMLNSGMIKNKSKGADRAKPGYEEVAKTRARILNGISPAEMSVKNLTSFLALFGIQRKEAVERVAKYFLFAVPCSLHTRALVIARELICFWYPGPHCLFQHKVLPRNTFVRVA